MINIENELYTLVKNAVTTAFSGAYVSGVYTPAMPSFPAVTFVEESNIVYANGRDSKRVENYATIMYEVNVYSNIENGKKAQCKSIVETIDGVLAEYGFARIMMQPVPNLYDATIYRITARYQAVVSNNKTIYRS